MAVGIGCEMKKTTGRTGVVCGDSGTLTQEQVHKATTEEGLNSKPGSRDKGMLVGLSGVLREVAGVGLEGRRRRSRSRWVATTLSSSPPFTIATAIPAQGAVPNIHKIISPR